MEKENEIFEGYVDIPNFEHFLKGIQDFEVTTIDRNCTRRGREKWGAYHIEPFGVTLICSGKLSRWKLGYKKIRINGYGNDNSLGEIEKKILSTSYFKELKETENFEEIKD